MIEKFDKMAQLNFDAIEDKVQIACGDQWLRLDVDDHGNGYPGALQGDERGLWDSVNKEWEKVRRNWKRCEELQPVLQGRTFLSQGSGGINKIIICGSTFERLLITPAHSGIPLDAVYANSLSPVLFHEMLHTDLLGECKSAQPYVKPVTWTDQRIHFRPPLQQLAD